MSVSSHLNPEPERRLWVVRAAMAREDAAADLKLGALAAFAAAEAAWLLCGSHGLLSSLSGLALAAAAVIGLYGVSPYSESAARLPLRGSQKSQPAQGDSMLSAADLAKYSHADLVNLLDRYLGGGVTATPYYEDIVAKALFLARLACRKRRLLLAQAALLLAGQLGLFLRAFGGRACG